MLKDFITLLDYTEAEITALLDPVFVLSAPQRGASPNYVGVDTSPSDHRVVFEVDVMCISGHHASMKM